MPARAKALRTKEEITAKKLNYIGKVQRILEDKISHRHLR
jgi:hypothetical protein